MGFFDLYAPPLTTGGEKALLHAHLQLNRDALLWKLEGLSEGDQRRPLTGTGTNLLGLVKHLTGVEGAAKSRAAMGPASQAARPAATASANAAAMATGFIAWATAVLISTASQPSSNACAACDPR